MSLLTRHTVSHSQSVYGHTMGSLDFRSFRFCLFVLANVINRVMSKQISRRCHSQQFCGQGSIEWENKIKCSFADIHFTSQLRCPTHTHTHTSSYHSITTISSEAAYLPCRRSTMTSMRIRGDRRAVGYSGVISVTNHRIHFDLTQTSQKKCCSPLYFSPPFYWTRKCLSFFSFGTGSSM